VTMRTRAVLPILALLLAAGAAAVPAAANPGEWPGWRGPRQDATSPETGLVSRWSPQGENLLWRADLVGRSTPVVFDGRVCANGRAGEKVDMHEVVACFDAGTGKKLWEHRLDVYNTSVPFNRVGWASVVGDPETGNLYAHGVGGLLVAFDRAGKLLWSRSLTEEFGFYSGFGGRTHTPAIDEDRLVLSFTNTGWGDQAGPPRTRTFAFDKRTGAVLWVSTPGENPFDLNTQTSPVVAVIGGQRLLIEGNADGWIYALKARTGEKVWGFQFSKSGLNTTVAVDGSTAFAAQSEENVDAGDMGRVVAIDATGSGDVTKTHERWRADEVDSGFPSPLFHDGRLYVVDNSANLIALDAATGKVLWKHKLGTVGKSSPVWADGKLYATEVNGRFHILKPRADGVEELDDDEITLTDAAGTRPAEIYGSPAVAYGRIYFTSEAGLFCLGDKTKPLRVVRERPAVLAEEPPAAGAVPALVQVVPAEVLVRPGEPVRFELRAFDDHGRALGGKPAAAEWSLEGLAGDLANGSFTPAPGRSQAGKVVAKVAAAAPGGPALTAAARVRVIAPLPWSEDFEAIEPGKNPPWWIGAGSKFVVQEKDGGKVLAKPPVKVGLDRGDVYLGPATLANYTIQADLLGSVKGRRRPDLGLINSGYTLDLMGAHQKVQLRSWASDLRVEKSTPFPWDPDVWYTMKFRVDQQGDHALVRGKVWRRGEPEPAEWTVSAEDPHPIRQGSPGLYGYSAADLYYDNLKVTVNEP
jgi:outer membrane protein assembly factor BamB